MPLTRLLERLPTATVLGLGPFIWAGAAGMILPNLFYAGTVPTMVRWSLLGLVVSFAILAVIAYGPAWIAQSEMRHRHYGLQALLYTVALHRYLRWRLPAYDPERHIAGVLYLFLRGMTGPDTPVVDGAPCGVFAWCPPGALIEALSDVFDRGETR